MKLKLLFTGLVISAISANAQLSTINENFNNFTPGNTTFPQNGWSAIVAPMTGAMPPVSPRMLVVGDTDKTIQSYAGNNAVASSYLIAPQIVAPTGDKTLSFATTLVSPSPGPGTLQIGLASNPTDMSTFVPVGSVINVTTIGAVQNISVNIPASNASYIVFKFTPSSNHVAIQIDNVVYNSATLGTSDLFSSEDNLKFALNEENSALQFVGKAQPKNVEIYSAVGQKAASGKVENGLFDISTLHAGVYFILVETTDGKAVKSKFIKK
ncbi:T9SS-dependent choice-of-anchor J family protein [Chryseobacterium wangxinyae]|uniref:T9SS-dependent choice-of-anchor J family protein n=1 Tax=Chryseobacterium sp. CY353 TaxID=2997334 RepID=UPI002271172B|nr:choice-of-anchor J domain-containing protein [Chryseobacterium sp. CY353]MCY0968070.1 choice-of-anchor J domain-containing protein [Chryseobacterium sp. CY353]